MADDAVSEKVFVSYSWTTPDHEEWVLNLAQELTDRGVYVIIDKWDLAEGQDANAFMERMVSDPTVTKVIMVCDKMYAEKANARKGGAGTEAQIMSPHIYASAEQKKFVAVLREKDADGKAYVPAYYGSRIFIDFCDEGQYADKFIQLERWIANKPLHVRPSLGKRPAYLDEDAPARMPTGVEHRRALDALRGAKAHALVTVDEYFRLVTTELKVFRLAPDKSGNMDEIMSLIAQMAPIREEVISVAVSLLRYRDEQASWLLVGAFLERIIRYDGWPEDVNSWRECNSDHYCFLINELFLHLLGFALSEKHFGFAAFLLTNKMLYKDRMKSKSELVSFMKFRYHLTSVEWVNARAQTKYYSLHAHMLSERAKHSAVKLRDLVQADFIAYLSSHRQFPNSRYWFPLLVLQAGLSHSLDLELFIRAKSKAFLGELMKLLGFSDVLAFGVFLEQLEASPQRLPSLGYETLYPSMLVNIDELGTIP